MTTEKASLQDCWEQSIPLANGLTFYLPSHTMRGAANYAHKEIFVRRRYWREGFQIQPDDTIIDVGVNMGMFVMWAAPQAPRGRVVAIEPTNVIHCLDMNVRLNHLENVISLQVAVGKEGSQLELIEYPGFNIVTHQASYRPAWITRLLIGLLYSKYRQPPVHMTTQCKSLGRIMDEQGLKTVNLLKVDCEGGEYEMFRNLTSQDWRRIQRISMEFHELDSDQKHQVLVGQLREQGFQVQLRKPLLEYYFMKFGEIWAWRA